MKVKTPKGIAEANTKDGEIRANESGQVYVKLCKADNKDSWTKRLDYYFTMVDRSECEVME